MTTQTLLKRAESGVLTLTLNRPEKLNAIDADLHEALSNALVEAGNDRDIRSIVLTGTGQAFSVGGDVALIYEQVVGTRSRQESLQAAGRLLRNLLYLPQPVLALVNGPASGLGATLALSCDFVLAADIATFSDSHVQMGLVAGDGGAILWPALMGAMRARRFLLTGDAISAPDAELAGLITKSLPAEDLLTEGQKLAARLSKGPRRAIEGTKALINKQLRLLTDLLIDESLQLEELSMVDPEHARLVDDFRGKRFRKF